MYVFLNSKGYTYDVHSLVKAFYPSEDVTVCSDEDFASKANICVFVSSGDVRGDERVTGSIEVSVPFARSDIRKNGYQNSTRGDVKNVLKRTLYEALSSVTGKVLPWGTMTGIRPTKVATKLIREGADDEAIARYMKSVYQCSDERIRLAAEIAHTEAGVMDRLTKDGFCLYVGIPFCPTTCMYCSFTSYPIALWEKRTDDYLDALFKELDALASYYEGKNPDCVYIGGGTPTTLSAGQLLRLTDHIANKFDLSNILEYTVEAGRPDSITEEKLRAIRSAGAERISINPQTMNDKTLRIIGRRHTVDDVYKAYEMSRAAGFSNINMDIILGLPGEDERDVANTFDRIKELSPDSITVHSMAIKRAAAMHDFLMNNKDIKSRITMEMSEMADECARCLGMKPYYLYRQKNMTGNFENVGYAREGCLGIYNIAIIEEVCDIAAAGAGTISKRLFDGGRIERCDNVKDVGLYIDRIDDMIDKKERFYKGE